MPKEMKFPADVRRVEKYLGIAPGELAHIPHYALESALEAIKNVRKRELKGVFRPGLYYVVLSDLSRSSGAAAALGQDLNTKRIETFILSCIEALGNIEPNNYFLPVREIGDAALIIFSSFADVLEWWKEANRLVAGRNSMWRKRLKQKQFRHFAIEAKTIIHLGEVAYSDKTIPISQAVNEVFKVEKIFRPKELGITDPARLSASPILREMGMPSRFRKKVRLPGCNSFTSVYVIGRALT